MTLTDADLPPASLLSRGAPPSRKKAGGGDDDETLTRPDAVIIRSRLCATPAPPSGVRREDPTHDEPRWEPCRACERGWRE